MKANLRFIFIVLSSFWALVTMMLIFGNGGPGIMSKRMVHAPGILAPMIVAPQQEPQQKLRILFIGNSYTYFNNMPGMVAEIARKDPGNMTGLEIQAVAKGGVDLEKLWQSGEARTLLQNNKWDYVVLQDQSFWALLRGNIKNTTKSMTKWAGAAKKAGAKPVLFMNWPRKPGSTWYNNQKYPFLKSSDDSYQRFHDQTRKLAKRLEADVVPVGDYWYFTVQKHPDIELYLKDGSHPGPAGSYLAALLFYRHFTGRSPESTSFAPYPVSVKDAQTLRKIASYSH